MNHRWKEQIKSTSLTPFFLFFLSFTGIILIPAIYLLLTPPTLAQAQSEQQVEADRLLQQGNQQFQVSQYREALQSWQKALDIFQQIGDRGGVAKSLNNLGNAYYSLGDYRKAIEFYQQSLAIYQEIRDRGGVAKSLGNLGLAYDSLGEYQKAIEFHQQSLAIKQEIGDRGGVANSIMNLGNAYYSLGEYQKAIEFHQQSLAIYQEIRDRGGVANSIMNLGSTYDSLGEYQKAIEFHQQSLAIKKEIGDRGGVADSLNNLGNAYYFLGEYPKSIEFYQQSLAIKKEIGDRGGVAKSLNNLGNTYYSLGKYQKAIDYYQQSLVIKQEIGDRGGVANSLGNLGSTYNSLGEYQKAIEYQQQSLAIKQEIGDRGGEAASLNNLGLAYDSLGEYQKAIEFHQQSLAIEQEIGDRRGEAASLNNLGSTYNSLGEYQKVIEYQQQSLAIFKEIGDRGGVANSLGNLGLAYRNLGKYQKAIKFYQQSLTIFKHIGDREGEGSIFSNFGILYEEQEQPELAIVFYKQSVIIRESIRQDIQDLDQQLQEFYTATVAGTYRRLADLLLSQDRIWEAQQVLELLKLQEIQDFTRSQKARRELAKVFISPQEQKIIDDYGKLIGFGQEIERCKSTQCPNLKQLQTKRNGLKKEFNQEVSSLESFIRQRNFDDFQQFLLPTSFNQTANKIIQASNKYNAQIGTAVIYPLVLKDKIWILWAVQGKVIGKREITNVGRQKLNQEILKLSLLVKNPHSDTSKLKETSQQLYDWLIRPLESELDNINHLAFSLDRGLRYIPMEVLHDGKQYLIEKYTVTTFISAQFTDTEDRLPSNLNETLVLGMGASQVDGYDPLPHVVTEIDAIVRENQTNDANGIYPGAKFLEKDFSWDNLWTNLEDKKLLHIATHGEFVPSSQDASFLVLGDGNKLTIEEIQILDDYLDNVHLVVLSACETAVGEAFLTNPKQEEGIEINALSFYFLSGGAKTVMASLWRVDDESTSQLMQRFYCTLANDNTSLTKAEALQKAKVSLLHNTPLDCDPSANNTDFTHPYYWSPFILIGNGL